MSPKKNDTDSLVADPDCSSGGCEPPMGDSLEAPKRPRSAAQLAAFERARAKRAENLKKKNEIEPEAEEKTPEPEPEAPAPPARRPRKTRSDKGKPRGFLVRNKQVKEPRVKYEDYSDDEDYSNDEDYRHNEDYRHDAQPANLYSHFLIV